MRTTPEEAMANSEKKFIAFCKRRWNNWLGYEAFMMWYFMSLLALGVIWKLNGLH